MRSKAIPAGKVEQPNAQAALASVDSCDDIAGILDSVDIPIIVVRRDCAISRFNRAASEVLGLTPSDIDCLPGNIRTLADMNDLEKLCSQVFAGGAPLRRDIRSGDRWFALRIAPCRGNDRQIAGAVLTFTNVTAFRASIRQAIYDRDYTKAILNTMKEPVVVLDGELRMQTANRAFYEMFGVSREEIQGAPLSNLAIAEWKSSKLWQGDFPKTAAQSRFWCFRISPTANGPKMLCARMSTAFDK
jgi:two-component system CheB/CheR fusion protein